jgi:hypothetical protein
MPYSAGGRWVPAPGQSYVPRSLKLSDGAWAQPKGSSPAPAKGAVLVFEGLRIELPPRAEVKIDSRARRAWVRAEGVIRSYVPEGEEHVTAEGARLLAESWALL